jgi:hypothetical protein
MARYTYKRTYEWTPALAYVVGLIASDGCLSGDSGHIDFTTKDLQLAETFRSIICPDTQLGCKVNGIRKLYFRVQFSNVALYDFFLKAGLTPNKSHTIQKINVPIDYFPDFLRGLFDGDGCIYAVVDKRWRNSFMYYSTIYSASYPFLVWLQNTIKSQLPEIDGHIKNGKRVFALTYAKTGSRQLFYFMYYDENVPRLVRKYKRYLEIFALDPYYI